MTDFSPLLEAVLEALSMPAPATVGDRVEHNRILSDRVMYARTVIKTVLEHPEDVDWGARYLRERLADLPPAYRAASETVQ
ncbi:hypothetical protein [Streptomyces erythrochromogenes]|uniref:hypothetical protein n=1 Tax=Streptomyces erythrochromogenes TaxID=285574 RepID=UPI002259552C|nr:hypothetical protein [Streptomyces erythrochromogenes]MCX5586045.1 hypothetical protein [Streptomyces erythrochromogenes]